MVKVLVVIPYKAMEANFAEALSAMDRGDVDFTLEQFYGTNPAAIENAGSYDVVVARGMTYHAIKNRHPSLHVIEFHTGTDDILKALSVVSSRYGLDARVGILTPDSYIADVKLIRQLTGFDILIGHSYEEEDMAAVASRMLEEGCNVLVGGGFLEAWCAAHDVRYVRIAIEETTIAAALSEAKRAALIIQSERLRGELERVIVEAVPFCVLALDHDCRVLAANAAAETFFERPLVGTSVENDFPTGLLEETLEGGREFESVQTIMGREVLVGQRPIMPGEAPAAFISIHELDNIYKAEGSLRQGLFKRGMLARYDFSNIITDDLGMRTTIAKAVRYAQSDCSVLVSGETGTGKELFVQAMHNASRRSDGPFVAINCASLSAELLESELFGYVEGAFTGAVRGGKTGLFELAHGGTIFLDEIGEIPVALQARLLRVLQEKEVRRVGGSDVIPVDARVICATNQDIPALIAQGRFRSDLYYRINLLMIHMPPLRERGGDVVILFRHFVNRFASEQGLPAPSIGEDAARLLASYSWPGNVRELRNMAERTVIVNGSRPVDASVLRSVDLPVESGADALAKVRLPARHMDDRQLYGDYLASGLSLAEFASSVGLSRTTLWRRFKTLKQAETIETSAET